MENPDPLGRKYKPSYKVTKYLEGLLDVSEIRKQFVPSEEELSDSGDIDPLSETEHIVAPKCVHKYADRILIWANNVCFANCRFCTRRRMIKKRESIITESDVDAIVSYLNRNPEIRDVIVSGGDPLVLSNTQLKYILSSLRKVPTVEIIRVGTRAPIVQPKRVTSKLVAILARLRPIYVNLHVNHPAELTDEVKRACDLMVDNGIVLGSQTVLLKGVNDNVNTLRSLFQKLLVFRVKPYYLYLADHVQGTKHFWTSEAEAADLMKELRRVTSGLCIPHCVRDTSERKELIL